MSTEQPRWIVLDDRDSRVSYTGSGWSSVSGTDRNAVGSFGETYRNTLRSTSTSGSGLRFTFTGDYARIMGTMTGRTDPEWECVLDDQVVASETPQPFPHNNQAFCKFYDLSPGEHTIGLNLISAESTERPLWFDQIQYKPTEREDGDTTYLAHGDPDLQYDSSWRNLGDIGKFTPTNGGSLTLRFIGTQLTWYGPYARELARDDASGSYTIDGGSPVRFNIRGGGDGSAWNRVIFATPVLDREEHILVVTYDGDGRTQTPLTVSQIFINDGTTQLLSASIPDTPGQTNPQPSASGVPLPIDEGEDKKFPPGAIAGIVVGVVVLVALAGFFLFYRRRKNQKAQGHLPEIDQGPHVQPFVTQPPGPVPPTMGGFGAIITNDALSTSNMSSTTQTGSVIHQKSAGYIGAAYPQVTLMHQGAGSSSDGRSSIVTSSQQMRAPYSKGQEAAMEARNNMSPTSTDLEGHPPGTQVITHHDSGVRLPQPDLDGAPQPTRVVEYPPVYTP